MTRSFFTFISIFRYKCKECNKEFFHFHLYLDTSARSVTRSFVFTFISIFRYKCKECNKEFNFHHSLKLHLYKHSGARPHKCGLCQKSYLTSNHLKNHVEAVHINSKKYVCNVCNKGKKYFVKGVIKVKICVYRV